MGKRSKKRKGRLSPVRRFSRRLTFVALVLAALFAAFGDWFVHHPRAWLAERRASLPAFVCDALMRVGNQTADITDALDITGHDAVYEYDEAAPAGEVLFAGEPRRVGAPAPDDIEVLDRGEFKIGFSRSLRHAVWCAYHVVRDAAFEEGKRPNFTRERTLPAALPGDFQHSGYDRGHLAPNHAMATRYGSEVQRRTFQMANIVAQTPALNRGVWRNVEHRIADYWTARYGEIWVIVGCFSPQGVSRRLPGTEVDVPGNFYQLVVAQEGMDVRAFAVVFDQSVPWGAYAARNLVSIDELESLTGLDFLPDLPAFIQDPLEADLPTRLWPVRLRDVLGQILLGFDY